MNYFDITSAEIKNRLIFENDLVFAFPSNMPIVPGHILICPKRIVSTVDDLTTTELLAIFDLQKQIKKSMLKTFGACGFNYAWNEGLLAGQTVNHLHLHILPRKNGDTGVMNYDPRKFLYRSGERPISPEQELIEIARLIKDSL
jgi:diadenosine tetraphosphate (Ap4A) HIT family hydrolase